MTDCRDKRKKQSEHPEGKGTRNSDDADKPAQRVSRSVSVTYHSTIRYVRHGFLLMSYTKFDSKTRRFSDIPFQKIS